MDFQRLQLVLKEIQICISDFEKELSGSEDYYQETLKIITDNELKSMLMEQHIIHVERQKTALAKMEVLYKEAQDQLAGLNKSN